MTTQWRGWIIFAVSVILTATYFIWNANLGRDMQRWKDEDPLRFQYLDRRDCKGYNQTIKAQVLEGVTGDKIKADDPELVTAIAKYFIDSPRPYVQKLSLPLFETPQAKEAMALLNLVSTVLAWLLRVSHF